MHIPHPNPRRKEILTSSPESDPLETKFEAEPDNYFGNWEYWVSHERESEGRGKGKEREYDICPGAGLNQEVENLPLSDPSPASTLIGGQNEDIFNHFLSEPFPASPGGEKCGYFSESPSPLPSLTDSSGGVLISELTTAQSSPTSFSDGRHGCEGSGEILEIPELLSSASSCAPISPTATVGTSSPCHQQNIPMPGEALANSEPFRNEGVMHSVPEAAAPFDNPSHAQEDTLQIKITELLKLFDARKEVQDENKIRIEIPTRFGPQVCEKIYSGMKDIFKTACYEVHPETEEPQCIHTLFQSLSSQESSSTSQSFATNLSTPRISLTPSLEFYINPDTGNKRKWSQINLIYKDSAVGNLTSIDETRDTEESRLPDDISKVEDFLQLSNNLSINERPVDNGGLNRPSDNPQTIQSLPDNTVSNAVMMHGALDAASLPDRQSPNQSPRDTYSRGRLETLPEAGPDLKSPVSRAIWIIEPPLAARESVQACQPLRKSLSRKFPKKMRQGCNDSNLTLVDQRKGSIRLGEVFSYRSVKSRSMDKIKRDRAFFSDSAVDVLSKARELAVKLMVPAPGGTKKSQAMRRGTLKNSFLRNLKVGVVAA